MEAQLEAQKIWQAALGELELSLSKANFTTWFKNTFISSCQDQTIIIGVPNTFTKAWLEKKYHSKILKALQKITENKIRNITYQVELKSKNTADQIKEVITTQVETTSVPAPEPEVMMMNEFGINPRYNFTSFVIGKGNELAQAASMAVSNNPGKVYNPLFIYGGVGLGKTHLMQALGNNVLKTLPNKKVIYVSCEKFTNDFIRSISTNQSQKCKNIYRSVDVLLVDDIQFLAGKEGTQEAFFHTFNDLHQANRQVVITSDRQPKAIPALESRLVSRFEWGMITDISMPDLETRSAILKTKCKEKNYELTEEISTFLATSVQNNIRELEGALNKIIAFHQLSGTTPTLESVKKILSSLSIRQQHKTVNPKQLIIMVAEYFDIHIEDILGSCRKKRLVVPRQIIMYLMREDLNNSYPAIGQEIGNRDHTTVMHAYMKISRALNEDEKIIQDVRLIRERIYNS